MNLFSHICLVTMAAPLVLSAQPAPDQLRHEIISGIKPFEANRFDFTPTSAKFVRVDVAGEDNQPCIDELEIFGTASDKNLALARDGAKVSASSCLPGYPDRHRTEFLNDGLYGNPRSWIPAETTGWITIELPSVTTVASVVLSRDRERKLSDRGLASFTIKTSLDGQRWTTLKQVMVLNASSAMNALLLTFDPKAIRHALKAMTAKHPGFRLPETFEKKLSGYEQQMPAVLEGLASDPQSEAFRGASQRSTEMRAFQREVLLSNPPSRTQVTRQRGVSRRSRTSGQLLRQFLHQPGRLGQRDCDPLSSGRAMEDALPAKRACDCLRVRSPFQFEEVALRLGRGRCAVAYL